MHEIQVTLDDSLIILQFDIELTSFERMGPYLALTVAGMAEKRPSLLIGDHVLASNPFSNDEIKYEGYVHEVHQTRVKDFFIVDDESFFIGLLFQVLLKFHQDFHSNYADEDYSIQLKFNRTPVRRCHMAIKLASKQLGK